MFKQKARITHVLHELLHYALEAKTSRLVVTIEELDDQVHLTVEETGIPATPKQIRQANQLLNAPERSELSDYYSGLAGEETCTVCDLRVVALMVDGGHVEASDTGTRIRVWWRQVS